MPTKDYTEILAGIKAEWITHQELADNEIRIFINYQKLLIFAQRVTPPPTV